MAELFSYLTFAISPQLFPASRMAFSLCSSAAVHGVFVRPFFLTASSVVAASREAEVALSELTSSVIEAPTSEAAGSVPAV